MENTISVLRICIFAEVLTELEKKAFRFSGLVMWNKLQTNLKLENTVMLTDFETMVKSIESSSFVCNCFFWPSSSVILC